MKPLSPEYTKNPIIHNKSQFNIKYISPIHKGKFTNGQNAQETVLHQQSSRQCRLKCYKIPLCTQWNG